jgi:amino acid adenylation domain-containing protein
VGVLLGELAALYRVFTADLAAPAALLPALTIQYADFAAWQRRWLAGPVLAEQLDYWRRQLAGAAEALDLPTDRPRPAFETSHGAHLTQPLPPALLAGLRTFSRRQGATLFMTLFAGFAALLHRLTMAEDLTVGTPVANRNRREIEGLLGFFVNTLVLRADLAGDPGFDALVSRVRETALAAYAHQDLPFERLVEELRPQRSLARSPLFQVQFVLGVGETVRELAPGLPLHGLPLENRTAKYDLTLALDLEGAEWLATVEYRTDLFEPTTILRWLDSFTTLLASAVERPAEPLSALPLLAPSERQLLLHEWNDIGIAAAFLEDSAPDDRLQTLFERQARRTPEATALVAWRARGEMAGEARLTYAELDTRADRLARYLRRRGVGPEVPVAVCLDRTPELVVTLLAILKAGGVYVPIDPGYPEERRRLLVADSGAPLAVTREALLPLLAGSGAVAVCLDTERAEIAREAGGGFAPAGSPGNLAYMIYTSGSTGRPKGVAIEHRTVVPLLHWVASAFPAEELSEVLAATSICFDISIFEIFGTLSRGGTVHLVDNALSLAAGPPGRFDGLTLIDTVPSAMAELLQLGAVPPSVRTVNLAGELLPGALVERVHALGTVGRVLNFYGPSEDTTFSTWATLPRGAAAPAIGRPVAGGRVYLVDRHLEPVPLGVPGEVFLAGAGLARGYRGRPELTAERFLPDPFAGEPGGRLYRVGDLARYRPDGELEFLGRLDHQVKLRGFRIELGEVEAVLDAHPAVERAVVATHAYAPEDVRLVAWVSPKPGMAPESLDGEALRAWVGARCPEFMVPAAVVALAALPLTPNGKIDRKALPPPAAPAPAGADPAGLPRSPLEELLAGLWAEVLGLPGEIGLHDDFFSLGGHSLLATRLLTRLRAATGVELPLRAVFLHPTVAALAVEVERSLRAPDAPALPPITPIPPIGVGSEAPASAGQERLWYFHQLDPGGAVLNVPHPLRLLGPLRPDVLAHALSEIGRRHAVLRTVFVYGADGLRQRIARPAAVRLPVVDLGALPAARGAEEARRWTDEEAREPFDLAAGPLWRARLLRLHGSEHRLLVTFHHTISDGASTDLFERELAALYEAEAGDRPSPLSETALQYADFAVWQRRWLNDTALSPQLDYWRRQLSGVPPALDLPADRPRPARQSFRGAARWRLVPPELAAGVQALGRREGATLFMTALAAFAVLLGRYTGRLDPVIGTPSANRHRPGTEGLLGFFVETLVLRLDLGGDPGFRELLGRAREVALGAYAHPDLPFERLVEELDPVRDKSRNPLVQILLSVQSTAGGPLRFAGLSAEPIQVHTATAQFDLTLFFDDRPEGLTLAAEFDTALFDGATVERLLDHLALLLAAVVADPDIRLSRLPAEIAPRPQAPAEPRAGEAPVPAPVDELARRQAQLAERKARLASAQKDLLESRLKRGR